MINKFKNIFLLSLSLITISSTGKASGVLPLDQQIEQTIRVLIKSIGIYVLLNKRVKKISDFFYQNIIPITSQLCKHIRPNEFGNVQYCTNCKSRHATCTSILLSMLIALATEE